MIEKNFDVPFVAAMALREKQIQQNYRPIIAVHKWFARRPGTLFRSLILSEFVEGPLRDKYFKSNKLKDIRIADPFMGGGTPLLEANRLGCDVIGYDINPMAYWIVRQEIEHLSIPIYRENAYEMIDGIGQQIGHLYKTRCLHCGDQNAHVKYFLWVKIQTCQICEKDFDLFPGYLLAEDKRHPKNVFFCPECGELSEVVDRKKPGLCQFCTSPLARSGTAKHGRCKCPHCKTINSYPNSRCGPPRHRMFAIEYHCTKCKPVHQGRFFKKPDCDDLAKYDEAGSIWKKIVPLFVPDDKIPSGDETDRLHKWGYQYYWQMFNERQLLGLDLSCRAISRQTDDRVRNALATNLSDLLRYQNMLCRYDTMALKSLDIFSVHGFPVGLVQCESNLFGIPNRDERTNIGSGGWSNIIEKYIKAKTYCEAPFEVDYQSGRRVQIFLPDEWIGDRRNGIQGSEDRNVTLRCDSATFANIPPASLDAVLTDPPYFGNVQYAELMDFCYIWLRRLLGETIDAFQSLSTRNKDELTGNITMDRGLGHFTKGLSEVFSRMATALKPGGPLVFTYHHNTLEAYYPIAVSILDAGLTCSASLPCPAEMGASIHINGTGSSIVDTIFVCRSTGAIPRRWVVDTPEKIANLVHEDLNYLRVADITPTRGDIRCIVFGHLIRMAIWHLRQAWDHTKPIEGKLAAIADHICNTGGLAAVEQYLGDDLVGALRLQTATIREDSLSYEAAYDNISF